MFEEFLGLPLHPLAVHAPIVLVPLLLVAAVGYALVPRIRGHMAWVAAILALLAPLSAVVAVMSGNALADWMYGAGHPEPVVDHSNYGNLLMWSSIAVGALTLVLVVVRRGRTGSLAKTWLAGALTVLLVVAAVVAGFFVFQVGHSGAEMVWPGRVP